MCQLFVPLAKKSFDENWINRGKKKCWEISIHFDFSRAYFSLFLNHNHKKLFLFICDNSDDNGKSFQKKSYQYFCTTKGKYWQNIERIKLKENLIENFNPIRIALQRNKLQIEFCSILICFLAFYNAYCFKSSWWDWKMKKLFADFKIENWQ